MPKVNFNSRPQPEPQTDPLDLAYTNWAKTKTPEAMADVLKAANPIITSATKSVGSASPTLQGRAKSLVINALPKYNPDQGVKLKTFLFSQMQPLSRIQYKDTQQRRIPERLFQDAGKLHRAELDFEDEVGHKPTTEELADRLGLSMKRIKAIRTINSPVSEGKFKDEEGSPYLPATEGSTPKDEWMDFVYHDCDTTDKRILEHTLGLYGQQKMNQTQIARMLNLSNAAVSQRAKQLTDRVMEGQQMVRDTRPDEESDMENYGE